MNKDKYFFAYKRDSKADEKKFEIKGNVLKNLEVFRTGVFREQLFEKDYLSQMIKNFKALKKNGAFANVPIRKNHPGMFGLRNTMEEVIGYVDNLKLKDNGKIKVMAVKTDKNGETMRDEKTGEVIRVEKEIDDVRLVADCEITEPKALEKIERTTYRDRSIEFGGYDDNNGNIYEPVLHGFAFVDIPQVDLLQGMFSKDSIVGMVKLDQDMNVIELDKDAQDEDNGSDETVDDKGETDDSGSEDADKGEDDSASDTPPGDDDDGKQMDPVLDSTETSDEETDETDKTEDAETEEDDKTDDVDEEDVDKTDDEDAEEDSDTGSKDTKGVQTTAKELKQLKKFKFDSQMKERYDYVEALKKTGFSTPAMSKLERTLVASFFALEGSEGYLSPGKQFTLFKELKASTPKVWEKKDDVKAIDDKKIVKGLRKKVGKGAADEASDEDYEASAQERLKDAGLA